MSIGDDDVITKAKEAVTEMAKREVETTIMWFVAALWLGHELFARKGRR